MSIRLKKSWRISQLTLLGLVLQVFIKVYEHSIAIDLLSRYFKASETNMWYKESWETAKMLKDVEQHQSVPFTVCEAEERLGRIADYHTKGTKDSCLVYTYDLH